MFRGFLVERGSISPYSIAMLFVYCGKVPSGERTWQQKSNIFNRHISSNWCIMPLLWFLFTCLYPSSIKGLRKPLQWMIAQHFWRRLQVFRDSFSPHKACPSGSMLQAVKITIINIQVHEKMSWKDILTMKDHDQTSNSSFAWTMNHPGLLILKAQQQ